MPLRQVGVYALDGHTGGIASVVQQLHVLPRDNKSMNPPSGAHGKTRPLEFR